MNRKRRILSIVLSLVMILMIIPAMGIEAYANSTQNIEGLILDSGTCGKGVKWVLYADKRLVLAGSGPMYNYDYSTSPFQNGTYSEIIIGEGITTIGAYIFKNTIITSIELPTTITEIEIGAFSSSTLSEVQLNEGLKYIHPSAFYGNNLTKIDLPASLKSINSCFSGNKNLKTVITRNKLDFYNIPFSGTSDVTIYYLKKDAAEWQSTIDFYNSEYHGQLKWQEYCTIDSNGDVVTEHTVVEDAYKAPTCTQTGHEGGTSCLVCKVILSGNTPIKATGHKWEVISDIPASYKAVGITTYKCQHCGTQRKEEKKITLAAPVITKITNVPGGVKLEWNKVEGAEKYVIWTGDSTSGFGRFVSTNSGIADIESGRTRMVYIEAVNHLAINGGTKSNITSVSHTAYTGLYKDEFGQILYYKNDNIANYTGLLPYHGKWYYFTNCSNGTEVLKTPKLNTIVNTTSGVMLTWGKVPEAEKYRIYRKKAGGNWTPIGYSNSNSFHDKTSISGTSYSYTVACYNQTRSYICSKYNEKGLKIRYLKSVTPTLSNVSSGIKIAWSKIPGATGYYVYRKTGSGSYKKIKTIKGNSTIFYTDKNTVNGTIYTYAVVAYNGNTSSNYTGKSICRLNQVSSISVNSPSSKKMTVKWSKNNKSTGYQVQYATNSKFSKNRKTINISSNKTTKKTIQSLKSKQNYYVRIRTYKMVKGTKYYSGWSGIKYVKTK